MSTGEGFTRRTVTVAAALALAGGAAFAQADKPLRIGFSMARTGMLANATPSQLNTYELWREQVNARGGMNVGGTKRKVEFVTYDDQSQGGRVQQLYTRLILQDKSQFLFSPYSSGLVATASVITEQYGKIMRDAGIKPE